MSDAIDAPHVETGADPDNRTVAGRNQRRVAIKTAVVIVDAATSDQPMVRR